ncbi:unnamed protein product, partial [Rotaria sp. Silwood2]
MITQAEWKSFAVQVSFSTGDDSGSRSIDVADFNNDTRLDIACVKFDSNSTDVFCEYGDGNFADQIIFSTGCSSGPSEVGIADFNNDNRLDSVIANWVSD